MPINRHKKQKSHRLGGAPVSGQSGSFALSKVIDQAGQETQFAYSVQNGSDSYFTRLSVPIYGAAKPYALLSAVTYPTGATSNYTYTSATGNLGASGTRTYFRLSNRKNTATGIDYGSKTITYQNDYSGYEASATSNPTSLPATYTYGATVTDSDGVKSVYTFNNLHLLTDMSVKSSSNATLTSQALTYNADNLPTKISAKTYNGSAFVERVEKYTYNNYGDVLTHNRPNSGDATTSQDVLFQQIVNQYHTTFPSISSVVPMLVQQIIPQATAKLSSGEFTTAAQAAQHCAGAATSYLAQVQAAAQQQVASIYATPPASPEHIAYLSNVLASISYQCSIIAGAVTATTQYFTEQSAALGNVVSPYTTTYTYDSTYHFVTSKVYKTNDTTTVNETYTATTDGKSVCYAKAYQNNVLKAQTEYVYDTYGNVTESRSYNDGFSSYNSTFNEYANSNTALPSTYNGVYLTRTYVTGVRNSDNALISAVGTLPAGNVETKYKYDAFGNLLMQTDANGSVTQNTYDALGRVTLRTNPDGTQKSWTYNTALNTVTATDELGNSVKYLYNALGNISSVVDVTSGTAVASYTYDAKLRLAQESALLSGSPAITAYTYDALGRVLTETVTGGGSTLSSVVYEYNNACLVGGKYYQKTTKTLVGGANAPSIVVVDYTDNAGNTAMRGFLLNGTEYRETYTHDYVGNVLTELSAKDAASGRSFTAKYTYDYAGRVLTETNTLNQTASRTYDALGRNVTSTDYSGSVANSTYDALGRLVKRTVPFETVGSTTYNAETRYDYDRAGHVTRERVRNNLPSGAESFTDTRYTYNSRGFLTQSDSYNGGSVALRTTYTYDAVGNALTQTVGTGAATSVTSYAYDRFGNVTTLTDALGQSESYTYDLAGNVLAKTDRNGAVTTNTYDALGRLLVSTAVTAGGATDTVTYAYSATGGVSTESNANTTITNTYDALGRVTGVQESGNVIKSYTYDLAGNRTAFVASNNGELVQNTAYTYDALGRHATVSDNGALTATYTYDTNGNRASLTYANGTSETYTYNRANAVKSVTNKRGSTVLSSYSYTYRLDGNQASKTDNSGAVTSYTYDGLGRLLSETTGSNAVAYTYDTRGNRATMAVSGTESYTTTYAYDLNNRLLSTVKSGVTTTYTYDANGSQLTKVVGSEPAEISAYNARGQLVAANIGGSNATYTYRPDGLRASKTVSGATTTHVWDGSNIVADVTSSAVTRYVRGVNLLMSEAAFVKQYYLYNAHGDVVQLTDSSGDIAKSYSYDAFGVEREPVATDANPWRYCGEYYDRETGSLYLRARYYDAGTGRFGAEDTNWNTGNMIYGENTRQVKKRADALGLNTYMYVPDITAILQSGNLYAYCMSNPNKFRDPSGKSSGIVRDSWIIANEIANMDGPYPYFDIIGVLVGLGGTLIGGGVALFTTIKHWGDTANDISKKPQQAVNLPTTAADIPAGLTKTVGKYGNFECVDAVKAMSEYLKKQKQEFKIIELRAINYDYIWCISLNVNVTTNGFHTGILYNDIAYDNLHPYGLQFEEWLADFDARYGLEYAII